MLLILFTVKNNHAFILQNCKAYQHAYKLDYSSLINLTQYLLLFLYYFLLLNLIN